MSITDVINARREENRIESVARWRRSLPPALRGYDMDELLETNWGGRISVTGKRKVLDYMEEQTPFMILGGGAGLGKSLMAAEICGRLLDDGSVSSALFADSPTFLDDLSFRHTDVDPVSKLVGPDILLLDDVGAGTTDLTSTRRNGIWSLVNRRWASGKTTVMTTNLPMASSQGEGLGLMDWFGESAWDRIVDNLTLVTFTGHSVRKRR